MRKANVSEIVIPELEKAAETYVSRRMWSERDIAVLTAYYHRVDSKELSIYLGRTKKAIDEKASDLGLHKIIGD